MKVTLLFLASSVLAMAQFPEPNKDGILPKTPTSFEPRNVGEASEASAGVRPENTKNEKITRYISQLALSEVRQWTSSDGKVIVASLLAFEDLMVESREGVAPPQPQLPKNPTVVQNGTVRLAINRKPVVLAISRLSKADQDFIEKVRLQHAPKP